MPGLTEGNGPSYISSHSADVILSDIRPLKLEIESLRSINVLLDEFLYAILSSSGSLSTDKLRASLLALLPTSLGKEALLEAEVELRAYWERTGSVGAGLPPSEDDSRTFNLQWAFELLRLKCEAYSTLNETDEDSVAESRVNEKMSHSRGQPPKSSLLAPASLYLTAIIEAMCEHILSNVGRVAARDSSRTSATVTDLFVALCEDDAIYRLFRSMNVYQQIEQLTKTPKTRRSKSISRSEKHSPPRAASPQVGVSPSASGGSVEGGSGTTTASNSGSRSSFEKARAMKMFMSNSRERDSDSQIGHKKSESLASMNSKHTYFDESEISMEEFDNAMRSNSTMKVSLTPDRLRTMETYKQERHQRANRRPVNSLPPTKKEDSRSPQKPILRPVDSIVESEEENGHAKAVKTRSRQASVATPPSASLISSGTNPRARSVSTSGTGPVINHRTSSTPPPSYTPNSISNPPNTKAMAPSRVNRIPDKNNGFPTRTRTRQRNPESLDLDEIMGLSEEDEPPVAATPVKRPPRTSSKRTGEYSMSAHTKELIDFLAEGPPEPPMSRAGQEMSDFLAQGPSNFGPSPSADSKPKGGRLQKMISILNFNNEKAKTASEPKSSSMWPPATPIRPSIQTRPSVTTLSSLANRPIPPRMPPRPISPPASPSRNSFEAYESDVHQLQKSSTSFENGLVRKSIHKAPVEENDERAKPRPPPYINGNSNSSAPSSNIQHSAKSSDTDHETKSLPSKPTRATNTVPVPASPPPPTRKPVPSLVATSSPLPVLSESNVRDVHRLMSRATSADECRLIFDLVLARSGLPKTDREKEIDIPYPSPSPSIPSNANGTFDFNNVLEQSLVELLLGGEPVREVDLRQTRISNTLMEDVEALSEPETPQAAVNRIRSVRETTSYMPVNHPTHSSEIGA